MIETAETVSEKNLSEDAAEKMEENVPVETVADGAAHIRQTKQEDVVGTKPARYHRHQYAGSFGRKL